jgi:hypothetical protein
VTDTHLHKFFHGNLLNGKLVAKEILPKNLQEAPRFSMEDAS